MASDLERDVLAFIAERHADRQLDVETASSGIVKLDVGPDDRSDAGCT
jgi:hypothetical protein